MIELGSIAELYRWLEEHSPKTILLSGLEDAIVGVVAARAGLAAVVYSRPAVLEVLLRDYECTYSEASVYFDEHLAPLYELHGNPVFIEPLDEPEHAETVET